MTLPAHNQPCPTANLIAWPDAMRELWAVARRAGQHREDVVQDVFAKEQRLGNSGVTRRRLDALKRKVRNRAGELGKKERRHRRLLEHGVRTGKVAVRTASASWCVNSSIVRIVQEFEAMLLDHTLIWVLHLKFVEGYDTAEVAGMVGISVRTAQAYVARVRRVIRSR